MQCFTRQHIGADSISGSREILRWCVGRQQGLLGLQEEDGHISRAAVPVYAASISAGTPQPDCGLSSCISVVSLMHALEMHNDSIPIHLGAVIAIVACILV